MRSDDLAARIAQLTTLCRKNEDRAEQAESIAADAKIEIERLVRRIQELERLADLVCGYYPQRQMMLPHVRALKLFLIAGKEGQSTRYCTLELGHDGGCLYGSFVYLGEGYCSAESPEVQS